MKKVFVPVDVITVVVERTKAAKLFQMSRNNIITVGKQLCQRGEQLERLLRDYGESQSLFLFFFLRHRSF